MYKKSDQSNHVQWVEKYRPETINDLILPAILKSGLQAFADGRPFSNLLLTGPPGVGKTTTATALVNQLGYHYVEYNGSDMGSVNMKKVREFCYSLSLNGKRRAVIFDEADQLPQSIQSALRKEIEEVAKYCAFIFICNDKQRLIKALHSRCAVIEFKTPIGPERANIIKQMVARASQILTLEKIKFRESDVVEVVGLYFPDFRRTLHELQSWSATGTLQFTNLTEFPETEFDQLMKHMKKRDFGRVREWTAQNAHLDTMLVLRKIYDNFTPYFQDGSLKNLTMIVAEYNFDADHVRHHYINLAAALHEIMDGCKFK